MSPADRSANLVIPSSCVQKCYCKPQRAKQHSCKMSELSTITLKVCVAVAVAGCPGGVGDLHVAVAATALCLCSARLEECGEPP